MRILQTFFFGLFLLAGSCVAYGQSTAKNIYLADPTIFYHKGVYYLYGTGGGSHDSGFVAYTSKDLIHWQYRGFVLTKSNSFGTKGFWAPQVIKYRQQYYMLYTADEHIAIAVAPGPLGPFTQKEKAPLKTASRAIDPFLFNNKGSLYLYYVGLNNGNKIYVTPLNKDMTGFAGKPKLVIQATVPWEDTKNADWKVTEGPTVIKHNNLYYLLYSANDFRNPDYAVGYAVASHPAGPFEKVDKVPFISKNTTGQNGSGHGDVLIKNGKKFYVFHTHFSNEKVAHRKTAIIRLQFQKQHHLPDQIKSLPETFRFLKSYNE